MNGEIFRFHQIWMKLIGVWPLDRHQRRSTIVFAITLSAQIAIVVTCLTHPLKKCLPKELKNDHHTRISVTMLGIVQQINYRVFGGRIVPFIQAAIDDSFFDTKIKNRNVTPGYLRRWDFIVKALFIHFVVVNSIWQLTSFINKSHHILRDNQEICKFNVGSTWIILVIPALSMTTFVLFKLSSFGSLMLVWSFVMHFLTQHRIMKEQFQDFLLMKETKYSRQKFRRLVERHNRLFQLGEILDNSCHVFVAAHVLFTQFYITLFAFRQISGHERSHSILTYFNFSNAILSVMTLYLYHHAGDCLTSCSEEIIQVFTQCNWYEFSKGSIVDFSIVIARCRMPNKLTAGKMYKFNIVNFKYVVNALYSYISCISVLMMDKDR